MFRAASLLKDNRLDREWELADISKKLKVPLKYLEAIENEDKSNFPQEPYCSLIVKDYAYHLGLNGDEVLALFRRDFDQRRKQNSHQNSFFSFTPQLTFRIFLITAIFLFVSYLVSEYLKFNQPPKLKVNWPTDNLSVTSIDVSGNTDSEATVRINEDLVLVDQDGKFQKNIELTPGENKITVTATSLNNKSTTQEKVVKSSL